MRARRCNASSSAHALGCPSRKFGSGAILDIFSAREPPWLRHLSCSSDATLMEVFDDTTVVSALMVSLVSLFQSRRALHLKVLALQHRWPFTSSRCSDHISTRRIGYCGRGCPPLVRLSGGPGPCQPRTVIAWHGIYAR
jgi:hypothetical protein